jgi:tRNA dimethylallyltransferase
LPRHEYAIPTVQVGLAIDYDDLDPRIDARVEEMWERGLVDEVAVLAESGLRDGVTARRAVGYAETLRHLDGELTETQTKELIKQHTRRLARKQAQWFRPDPRVTWLDAPATASGVRAVAQKVVALANPHVL